MLAGLWKLIGAIFEFLAAHIKEIVMLAIAAALFGGGMYLEKKRKDLEIDQIHADYKLKEEQRQAAIDKRVQEIEDAATQRANQLQKDKNQAESDVAALQRAYIQATQAKAEHVAALEKQLAELKAKGAPQDQIEKTERELGGLKLSLTLSTEALNTINGFVEKLGK